MSLSDNIEAKKQLLKFQASAIVYLVFAASVMFLVTKYFLPDYFPYTYFKWTGWESVLKFWPVLVWSACTSTIGHRGNPYVLSSEKNELLRYGLITSTLAGIWEEFGYRWIYIFYGMVSLSIANFFFSPTIILSVIALGSMAFGIATMGKSKIGGFLLFLLTVALGYLAWISRDINSIYWIYEHIVVNFIHFTTFGLLDPILYGDHNKAILFGAIIANSWFRDGHKYQGPPGVINSWYIGMILLYATLMYGLWTAIIIHVLYDIVYDLSAFIATQSYPQTRTAS